MARDFEHWIALGDTHGDMAHLPALRAVFEFIRYWKPKIRIAAGDHFDLRPLRKGAMRDESIARFNDDMNAGAAFLHEFRPTHYLWGNHEDRIRQWQDSAVLEQHEFAQQLEQRIKKVLADDCMVYPYCKDRGVMRYGNFALVHGYAHGIYALKKHVEAYGNVIMWHIHSNGIFRAATHSRALGFSSGSLCALNMDYNRAHMATLRQSHGFAYGFRRGAKLHVFQAYPVDGTWYFPTEMKEISNATEPRRKSRKVAKRGRSRTS